MDKEIEKLAEFEKDIIQAGMRAGVLLDVFASEKFANYLKANGYRKPSPLARRKMDIESKREQEISKLFQDISNSKFRNITHPKARTALAIYLYETGYRIPVKNLSQTALRVALEWIRAKGRLASFNSELAPDFVKAKSDKGLFISIEDFNNLYDKGFIREDQNG